MNDPNYKVSQTNLGHPVTQYKIGKLFQDLIQIENQLEMHRKYKLS